MRKDYFFKIENPHTRDDGLLSDFCDGDVFRAHPLFSRDPHALQLILYFDEFEVCNPLGSRANKHKIGMWIQCLTTYMIPVFIYIFG